MSVVPDTSVSVRPPVPAPRILVIDDCPSISEALSKLLSRAHFDTTVSNSGLEALKIAAKEDFDAVVVDVHLGDVNGLLVAQRLRERLGDTVPIVVLSGDTSLETINSLQHVGATYFYSKPVNADDLITRLKGWISPTVS